MKKLTREYLDVIKEEGGRAVEQRVGKKHIRVVYEKDGKSYNATIPHGTRVDERSIKNFRATIRHPAHRSM